MTKKKMYIYFDADHLDLELFSTLANAKKFADKQWPDSKNEEWEDNGDHLRRGEYEHIFIREVDVPS